MEPSNNGRRRSIRNLRRSSSNFQVPTNLFEEEDKENESKSSTFGSLWVQEEESTSDRWRQTCEGEPQRETDSSTNNQTVHECSGFLVDIPDNTMVWPNLDEFDRADISITQDSDSIPISRAVSLSPYHNGSPQIHINMVDSAKVSPDKRSATDLFIGSTEDLLNHNRDVLSESLAKPDLNICFNQTMFSLSDEEVSLSIHKEIDNIVNTTYVIDEEPTLFTDDVQSFQHVSKVQSRCIDVNYPNIPGSIGSVPTITKLIISQYSSDILEKEHEIVSKKPGHSTFVSESELQTSSSSSSCSSSAPTKPSQKTDVKNKKTSKHNKRLSLNKKVSENPSVNDNNSLHSQETLAVSHNSNNVNGIVGDLEWLSMTEITNSCKKRRAKLCDKKKRYSAKLFMDNLDSNLAVEEDIWNFESPKLTSNFSTVQQQVVQHTEDIQCREKQTDFSNELSLGDSVNNKTKENLIEKKKRRRSSNLFRPHSDFSKQLSENINNDDNIVNFQSLSLHVPELENNSSQSIRTNDLCSKNKHDDFDYCSLEDKGDEFDKQMPSQSSTGYLETEPDLIVNTLRFCEEEGKPKLSTMDIISIEEIGNTNDDNGEELFNLSSMKNIKRPSRTKANRKSWNLYQSVSDVTTKKEKKPKGAKRCRKKKELIEISPGAEDTLPLIPPPTAHLDQTPTTSASSSPEVQINEELENLYRNKNYVLPVVFKQWQTIKEDPTAPRTFFSKNHFFRYLDFENPYRPTECKLKQRHSRAVKFMRGKTKIKPISVKRFDKKMSELKTLLDSP